MTDKTMKLYQYADSPNSRRVRIFLAEKGLSIPLIPIDLSKGEQHSDAYRHQFASSGSYLGTGGRHGHR